MAKNDRIKVPKYPGIYYRESTTRRFKGRPDRVYWIFFQANGRRRWVEAGRASDGVTAQYASQRRATLVNQTKLGEDLSGQAYTVGRAFDDYFGWMEREAREVNRDRNRYELHIAPDLANINLDHLTVEVLDSLKHKLGRKPGRRKGSRMSSQSIKHVLGLLRRVVNWAIREGHWRGANPIGPQSRFKMPRVQNEAERFFTPTEVEALLSEARRRSRQLYDMCLLALNTGLRATEIFRVRVQDIDYPGGLIWITAKGGKREKVWAGDEVLGMLAAYDREPGELVFQKRGGGPIREVSDSFGRAVDALGLNEGVTDRRQRVWFHTWRHTFISWLAQSGEYSLLELQQLARHARIEMTMRYAHLIPDDRTPAIDVIKRRRQTARADDHRQGLRLVESQATLPDVPDGTEHTDQPGNKKAPALPTA